MMGAAALLGHNTVDAEQDSEKHLEQIAGSNPIRRQIFQKVWQTPFIDSHEHLVEEKERFPHDRVFKGILKGKGDDWSLLFSHYIDADMLSAGMPIDVYKKFFSPKIGPIEKWELLKPYWPAIQNTGYGLAVTLAIAQLYGVEELSTQTIRQVQDGYEKTRRPGFYRDILRRRANIESCQVNTLGNRPFTESDMPDLLMQDLSILGMIQPNTKHIKNYSKPAGITVNTLSDWHRVIDWWFETYGRQAVAVKSQHAYYRSLDHEWIEAEQVEDLFTKHLAGQSLAPDETKAIEDHLFWYSVKKATEYHLPIKLHIGYYNGTNKMPIEHVQKHPCSVSDLCRLALKQDSVSNARFVFMHIGYPYYESMIALAKHYSNAYIDMCWSWIINPIASKDFLKKYLATAPANKVLTFGGDYIPVEPVLGHAIIARRGIAQVLSELVEEDWLPLSRATELAAMIMNGNARKIFSLS